MKKFQFNSTEQFQDLFSTRNLEVTDAIVEGIENAMVHRKRTAKIFSVTFANYEVAYEISLPKVEWVGSLDSCLDFYHENNETDKAIDTWKLRETAKVL